MNSVEVRRARQQVGDPARAAERGQLAIALRSRAVWIGSSKTENSSSGATSASSPWRSSSRDQPPQHAAAADRQWRAVAVVKSQITDARPGERGIDGRAWRGPGPPMMSVTSPRQLPQSQPSATSPEKSTPKRCRRAASRARRWPGTSRRDRYLPSTRPSWLVACRRTEVISLSASPGRRAVPAQSSSPTAVRSCTRNAAAGQSTEISGKEPRMKIRRSNASLDQRAAPLEQREQRLGRRLDLVGALAGSPKRSRSPVSRLTTSSAAGAPGSDSSSAQNRAAASRHGPARGRAARAASAASSGCSSSAAIGPPSQAGRGESRVDRHLRPRRRRRVRPRSRRRRASRRRRLGGPAAAVTAAVPRPIPRVSAANAGSSRRRVRSASQGPDQRRRIVLDRDLDLDLRARHRCIVANGVPILRATASPSRRPSATTAGGHWLAEAKPVERDRRRWRATRAPTSRSSAAATPGSGPPWRCGAQTHRRGSCCSRPASAATGRAAATPAS